tara:strand:- start:147 stop:947 length:801 start_codon:yes stop_codon:yes gene_type:complete
MKKTYLILAIAFLMNGFAYAGGQETEEKNKIRKVNNNAFQVGEKLEYKISYGFINAATATLEVKKSESKIHGREVLHIVGIGESISTFDWFFKIRDRYETYIDEDGIFPWLFIRRIHEGGYEKAQDYQFYQEKGKVVNEKNESYEVPHGVQDMLSAFYFARTMDFSKAKKGDVFSVQSFVDEELYPIDLVFGGKKTIKIKKGKFDCLVFHPRVQEGRVFKTNEDLTFYITNDENKIPVLVKANVKIGSLKMELVDYKNLANPLALK